MSPSIEKKLPGHQLESLTSQKSLLTRKHLYLVGKLWNISRICSFYRPKRFKGMVRCRWLMLPRCYFFNVCGRRNVCRCTHVYGNTCICVDVFMKAIRWPQPCSSVMFSLFSMTWSSPIRLSWVASEPQESTCLQLLCTRITRTCHLCPNSFNVGSGDQTLVLMLNRQALYWLGHIANSEHY